MKTIAFYSYKGGVGRSLFVANLATFLAHFAAKKVLAVDFDFEAPGLHYKFKITGVDVPPIQAGLVDTLDAYLNAPDPPKTLPILELKKWSTGGALYFYPAGAAPRTAYWQTLAKMDFHALMRDPDHLGTMLFREVLEHVREDLAPDIVLVDARTGVSDLGGAAAQIWADEVFCLMLDEEEHLEGSRAVMRGIARCPRVDRQGLIKVVPVLSRVHTVYGSPEEIELRKRIWAFLNEPGPSAKETLSIASPDDVVVLHNDNDVYRTGRVLLDDMLRGGTDHPSRLVRDYYDFGIDCGLLSPVEKEVVRERVIGEPTKIRLPQHISSNPWREKL